MPKPRLLGIEYGAKASPVKAAWESPPAKATAEDRREARAKHKSLRTFESRARANPLAAGEPVAHDRWPRDLPRDYGPDIPNLFRFELADRWRGYYALVGEPGGCRIWVLYLWDHATYGRQSGYEKK